MTTTELNLAKISSKQTSTAMIVALFASSLAVTDEAPKVEYSQPQVSVSMGELITPSYHDARISEVSHITDAHLAEAMIGLHEKLISESTELDAQAEKVLCDHLWDLYI